MEPESFFRPEVPKGERKWITKWCAAQNEADRYRGRLDRIYRAMTDNPERLTLQEVQVIARLPDSASSEPK